MLEAFQKLIEKQKLKSSYKDKLKTKARYSSPQVAKERG
jgi:hypothetical protein